MAKRRRTGSRPLAALDTETTGPDFFHGCKPFYVSTCTEDGTVRSWGWDVDPFTREPEIPSEELKELQKFIDGHRLVFHNIKFDVRALDSIGINVDHIWDDFEDTLVLSHVIDNSMPHGLKYLCEHFLDLPIDDQQDLRNAVTAARRLGKKLGFRIAEEGDPHFPGVKFSQNTHKWAFDMWLPRAICEHENYPPIDTWWTVCAKYGDTDAVRTISLHEYFQGILEEHPELRELYEIRKKALRPLYDMERVGLTFRLSNCDTLIDRYNADAENSTRIAKALVETAGGHIDNLGSFPQLQDALFKTLNVPSTPTTKTGFSTKKEDLIQSQAKMRPASKGYRFIKHLTDINQRNTAVSYLKGYKRFCLPYFQPELIYERYPAEQCHKFLDIRVLHPNINLTGTRTTRQSSNSPNGQNISKKEGFNLRSVFGPAPGRIWYSVDYANIELRILAWESEEEDLIEAFLRNESIHMKFAYIVCPELIEKAGSPEKFKKTQQYRYVKNGDFALTYGASAKTADAAYHIPGAYYKVRKHFTNLDTYMRSIISLASRRGYVSTRMAVGEGYPLYVTPGKAYTQAVDYVCQGTAGWAMLLAMIQCYAYLEQFPEHHMTMTIHDELLFDFPYNDTRNTKILSNCCHLMEASGNAIAVPLSVEAEEIKTTWDKGVKIEVPQPSQCL